MKTGKLLFVLFAIVNFATVSAENTAKADLGPMNYDASGTMPCSVGDESFDGTCGWRVLRKDGGGAELWISNIAVNDRPAYRVLTFSEGEFSDRDGGAIEVAKEADMWTLTIDDREHYRFPDAVITGG